MHKKEFHIEDHMEGRMIEELEDLICPKIITVSYHFILVNKISALPHCIEELDGEQGEEERSLSESNRIEVDEERLKIVEELGAK